MCLTAYNPKELFIFRMTNTYETVIKTFRDWGFPDCLVVRNPPASVGNVGLTPGPGGSLMLQSNYARCHTIETVL